MEDCKEDTRSYIVKFIIQRSLALSFYIALLNVHTTPFDVFRVQSLLDSFCFVDYIKAFTFPWREVEKARIKYTTSKKFSCVIVIVRKD